VAVDFESVQGILFDMDGVWFVGDVPVPGAVETLERVRGRELPCRFVTNTTTRTRAALAAKMARLGFEVDENEIVTAPRAAAIFLRSRGRPSCHLIVDDDVRGDFREFPESQTPDYVVVGDVGNRWSYEIMNDAFGKLVGGAELVALHKGRYWQTEGGLALDIGAFVAGLEYATGKEATVAGKPSGTFFAAALDDMGLSERDVVMVGDDVHADVGGAQNAGMAGVLVKTGKYREGLVRSSGVTPDLVVDSVAELRRLLG
jgi:HAD superfamily hydrolase (TIGR01458 family)